MFRKFLLFLLRVTDKNRGLAQNMTDGPVEPTTQWGMKFCSAPTVATPSVNIDGDVTIEKIRAIVDNFHNSHHMNLIFQLNHAMAGKHSLSTLEQKLLDEVIEKYNTKYKSPLAKAMSEQNNEK